MITENQDDSWHSYGKFPPVGTTCKFYLNSGRVVDLVIRSHREDDVCLGWSEKDLEFYGSNDPNRFKPLLTEKEKAIAGMKQFCEYPGSWNNTYKPFAEALYDAGFRFIDCNSN